MAHLTNALRFTLLNTLIIYFSGKLVRVIIEGVSILFDSLCIKGKKNLYKQARSYERENYQRKKTLFLGNLKSSYLILDESMTEVLLIGTGRAFTPNAEEENSLM